VPLATLATRPGIALQQGPAARFLLTCLYGCKQHVTNTISESYCMDVPRKPKRAARNNPRMATVRAFLSDVCLSNQATSRLAGGGLVTMTSSWTRRFPQYLYMNLSGRSRTRPSTNLALGSKPCFWMSLSRNLADFGSVEMGNRRY
jgi:hypothetical protein